MASRSKKGSEVPPGVPPIEDKKPRKRKVSAKTSSVPRSGKAAKRAEESEAQIIGVDVVPTVEITTAEPETVNRQPSSLLSDWDYHLFNEGSHHKLWEKLGSHPMERDGV